MTNVKLNIPTHSDNKDLSPNNSNVGNGSVEGTLEYKSFNTFLLHGKVQRGGDVELPNFTIRFTPQGKFTNVSIMWKNMVKEKIRFYTSPSAKKTKKKPMFETSKANQKELL